MGEEVKKSRPAPDPNSAKFKLGKIAADAYTDAIAAKERGELVGWCASNFPVEIPETLGLYVCYPENQAAGIAARGGGVRLCNEAESEGYSNDICAYARISLAYLKVKDAPEQNMPQPDFVLCCNNICNCMIKWYENIAIERNIPMYLIDIPYNPDYEVSDAEVEYVREQFWDVIHSLEEYTGKKWSDEKFKEVMEYSGKASRMWIEATSQAKYIPSPFNGFDLLNHMAVMVTARGKKEAGEAMEQLLKEYKELFGEDGIIQVDHAGLECSVILGKYPHLDVVSLGPTMKSPHTTTERALIATVAPFWELLKKTLEDVPVK